MPDIDQKAKAEYQAAVERIRADTNLTPDGKKNLLARLDHDRVNRERAASAAVEAASGALKEAAEGDLFGFGNNASDMMLFRSARDMAERTRSADELVRLVARGVTDHDDLLSLAALRVSFERGLTTVARAYQAAYPSRAELVDAYLAATVAGPSKAAKIMDSMTRSWARPAELSGYSDAQIKAMADEVVAR